MTSYRRACVPVQLLSCAWLRSPHRAYRLVRGLSTTQAAPLAAWQSDSPARITQANPPGHRVCTGKCNGHTSMTPGALSCQRLYASTTFTTSLDPSTKAGSCHRTSTTTTATADGEFAIGNPHKNATNTQDTLIEPSLVSGVYTSRTNRRNGAQRAKRSTRSSSHPTQTTSENEIVIERAPALQHTIVPPTPSHTQREDSNMLAFSSSLPSSASSTNTESTAGQPEANRVTTIVGTAIEPAEKVPSVSKRQPRQRRQNSPARATAPASARARSSDRWGNKPQRTSQAAEARVTAAGAAACAAGSTVNDETRHAETSAAAAPVSDRTMTTVCADAEDQANDNDDADSAESDEEHKRREQFFATMMTTSIHGNSTAGSMSPNDYRRPLVEESTLVYNTLTGRMMSESNPIIQFLLTVGFGINRERQLYVASAEKLNTLASRVREGTTTLPGKWPASLNATLGAVLRNRAIDNPADAIAQVVQVKINSVMRSRYASVVTSSDVDMQHTTAFAQPPSTRSIHGGSGAMAEVSPRSSSSSSNTGNESSSVDNNKSMDENSSSGGIELNAEQERVLDIALRGHHLYIGGSAGTGKTVLLRVLNRRLQAHRLRVAVTATTGVAGCHVGGATFHHTFGVSARGDFLRRGCLLEYDVIIIDEVSMFPQRLFEEFDAVLREEAGTPDLPFGGVQLILCGDFLQLGCINEPSILSSTLFHELFVKIRLQVQVRQSAYPKFAQDLQEMRMGRMPSDLTQTVQQLPAGTMVESAVNLLPTNKEVHSANEKELARLAGDPITLVPETGITSLRCETTATLLLRTRASFDEAEFAKHVRALLQATLDLPRASLLTLYRMYEDGHAMRVVLPGGESVAWREAMRERFLEVAGLINDLQLGATVTEIVPNGDGLHTPECEEYLHKLMAKHPVAQPLTFKKGCRVLLRANLSSHLVNGSIGTVVDFVECRRESFPDYLRSDSVDDCIDRYRVFCMTECGMPVAMVPVVQFYTGQTVAVPPWDFAVGGSANTHFYSLSTVALPLSLAYAFTVHKVQGLTLIGRVHLELSRMWPCEHLLYVAMSRVRNPEQLSMSSFSPGMIVANAACVRFDEQLPTAHAMDNATLARYPVSAWRRCNDTIYHLRRRGCSLRRLLQDVTRGTSGSHDSRGDHHHHHHHHHPHSSTLPHRSSGTSSRQASSAASNYTGHFCPARQSMGNSDEDAPLRIGSGESEAFADAFTAGEQQENYLRHAAHSVVYRPASHSRATRMHLSHGGSEDANPLVLRAGHCSLNAYHAEEDGYCDANSRDGGGSYHASMMYMTAPGDHLASIENSVLVARRMRKLVRHAERVTKVAEARRRSKDSTHAEALIVGGVPLGHHSNSMHISSSNDRNNSNSSSMSSGGGGCIGIGKTSADVVAQMPTEYSVGEGSQAVEEHFI